MGRHTGGSMWTARSDVRHCVLALSAGAAIALAGGCGTSRFALEESAAELQIEAAKNADAPKDTLEPAYDSLRLARAAEKTADKDLEKAKSDGEEANARLTEWSTRRTEAVARRTGIETRLAESRTELTAVQARQTALKDKGVEDADVRRATGLDLPKAELRVASLEHAAATLGKQQELADLMIAQAEEAAHAARSLTTAAEQRLLVAQSLYMAAEQLARVAEVEALSSDRDKVDARLLTPAPAVVEQ